MSRDSRPPTFKPFRAPLALNAQRAAKVGKFRGSSRERGYDSKWDRLSLKYRKLNPFCEWCEQEGKDRYADLVDHIIPVADRPEVIHQWKMLWSLCSYHHGEKSRWESYARENGLIDQLPRWAREPETRPQQFQSFVRTQR